MIASLRRCMVLGGLLLLGACGAGDGAPPGLTVVRGNVELTVAADGELIAAEALPIALPGSIRMGFNIAWMAPEFSEVRAGDVIARFDDVQIRLEREETELEVARSEFRLADTARQGDVEQTRISHEADRVEGERDLSLRFQDVDQTLFSRNEIIDALADVEYLDVEAAFLEWQAQTFDQRSDAQRNLIVAEQQGALSKLEKQDKALDMMALRSPADGTFVYARTPWGEKLGKGKTVWPGRPIGLLPVRGKVKARLYVPEADAVGLAEGQTVRLRLDAAAERLFAGKLESVSSVASPRDRADPQKFFVVEATIDEVDPDLMRVGSRLRAEIVTARVDDGIVIPAQSVYGDGTQAYVYRLRGDGSERRPVQIGQRSPYLVEVTDGLDAGDRISLVPAPDAA